MRSERIISTIDSHTAGMPTLLVVSGFPGVKGQTMAEKRQHIIDHYDDLVRMIIEEPRGHAAMRGAILFPPSQPETNAGVVFIGGGCMPSCGHSSIGVAVTMIESNLVEIEEPITRIILETPAGIVETIVEVQGGKAEQVRFQNVPAFLYMEDIELEIPSVGKISLDVAYGGNFFAILEAEQVGLKVEPENVSQFIAMARIIKDTLNKEIKVTHPLNPIYDHVSHVEFFGPPSHKDADVKNIVISPPGMVDRSPCGSGTCAKMAVLSAKNQLKVKEDFVHESVIGTLFKGRFVKKIEVGEKEAIVPEIFGTAYITGLHSFMADPEDPLKYGFRLG